MTFPKDKQIITENGVIEWDKKDEEWRVWTRIKGGIKSEPITEKEIMKYMKDFMRKIKTLVPEM